MYLIKIVLVVKSTDKQEELKKYYKELIQDYDGLILDYDELNLETFGNVIKVEEINE